ncbi:O-acyltransferase like protein-like isoform X2 [Varroa destructor]|uniref:Nose resistant-to-fluoxetine protein N-terminal domain-containing protein n=1 Tax=Varroa destructor TaxID=109461 RepID=A0A7M7KSF3_VARDE|nr:O-acyltransferase like protein-like isoform X2 [Varroa destructor]
MLLKYVTYFVLVCETQSLLGSASAERTVKFIQTDLSNRNQNLTWDTLMGNITDGIGSILNQALPHIVRATSEIEIGADCTAAMFKFFLELRKLTPWALRMADASGKPPAGLLEGTLALIGSYDECLSTVAWKHSDDVHSSRGRRDTNAQSKNSSASSEPATNDDSDPAFVGSYCTLQMAPNFDFIELFHNHTHAIDLLGSYLSSDQVAEKTLRIPGSHVSYRVGLCVPSACTKDDIDRVVQHLLKDVDFQGSVTRCEIREEVPVSNLQMAIMATAAICLILVTLGTLLETCCGIEDVARNAKEAALNGTELDSLLVRLVRCFSLQGNLSELLGLSSSRISNLAVLDGIRSLSMLWVIFGHTYFFVENVQPFRSILNGHQVHTGNIIMASILNFTLSVDSFFLLSGLLIMYSNWREFEFTGTMKILPFICNKYWRMLPGLMATMGILFLLPLFGDGPFWKDVLDNEITLCESKWWTNLIFMNNVFNNQEMCLVATWYLACAFQFVLLAPLLVIPLYRSFLRGFIVNFLFILGGSVLTAGVTFLYNLPPGMIFFPDLNMLVEICSKVYQKPYNHVGPFCVGILLGYAIRKHRNMYISKWTQFVLWTTSAISCTAILVVAYPWNQRLPPQPVATVYAATHRVIWSLGISWLIFACISGKGGPVAAVLSWGGFGVLGRLAYLGYLIHPLLILYQLYSFCGHLVVTLALSTCLYVFVEGPCLRIANEFLKQQRTIPNVSMTETHHRHDMGGINNVTRLTKDCVPNHYTTRNSCKL